MSNEHTEPLMLNEQTAAAVAELEATIRDRYPSAAFVLSRSPEDPSSLHLNAIVDVDDPDEVGDLVLDRVLDLNVEEGIPVHVIPLRPPERIAEERARRLPLGTRPRPVHLS